MSMSERKKPTTATTPASGLDGESACWLPRRGLLSGFAAVAASTLIPAALTRAQAPQAGKAPDKPWRVDVHRHIAPPGYVFDPVRARVNDRAPVAAQLEDMDKAGTALSIVTIGVPDADLPDAVAARKFDRLGNEYGA
jgi:6-methylsalicylate decarboxylase